MSTGLLEPPVAKRTDVTVKIDSEVVRLAKIVAAYRGSTVADYLSESLLPIVQRDLEREQRATQKTPAVRGRKVKTEGAAGE